MLRNRIYTALGLAALTAATIFLAPFWLFALIFAAAACVGVHEWAAFAGLTSTKQRVAYVVGWLLLVGVALAQQAIWLEFVVLTCLIWLFGFVSILLHPAFSKLYQNRWVAGVLGWVLLLCAWISLMTLFQAEHGKLWLLWLFVLTTATDVGGFFVGRAYGQHPMALSISPGKTREGAAGGVCLALIICVSALVYSGGLGLYAAIGLTLTMSVISIFGDLFESLMKRVSGVKDSGDLLPGHGGVLDRIDSIVAVLPFLAWSIV
jgi:phosphatidate cytidylyltransferase